MTVTITAKSRTISNGTTGDATPVEQNFTDLYNNDDALKQKVDNLLAGEIEDATTLTLNSAHTAAPASDISIMVERGTADNVGIRWDETNDWWEITHDGTNWYPITLIVAADPGTPTEGMIWYNTTDNVLRYHDGTATRTVSYTAFPKGYLDGGAPTYTSAATVTFPSGLKARSNDNTGDIELAADVTVTLASVWVVATPGLDAGAEAADTWYYFYLIKRVDTGVTSVIASTVNEDAAGAITLPANYTLKRQLPIVVKNDASSNIVRFKVLEGWPLRPRIIFDVDHGIGGTDPTRVLSSGAQTVYTAQSLANFVPPISRTALLYAIPGTTAEFALTLRPTGGTDGGQYVVWVGGSGTAAGTAPIPITTDSNRSIDWKMSSISSRSVNLDVYGFVVDQM